MTEDIQILARIIQDDLNFMEDEESGIDDFKSYFSSSNDKKAKIAFTKWYNLQLYHKQTLKDIFKSL